MWIKKYLSAFMAFYHNWSVYIVLALHKVYTEYIDKFMCHFKVTIADYTYI